MNKYIIRNGLSWIMNFDSIADTLFIYLFFVHNK